MYNDWAEVGSAVCCRYTYVNYRRAKTYCGRGLTFQLSEWPLEGVAKHMPPVETPVPLGGAAPHSTSPGPLQKAFALRQRKEASAVRRLLLPPCLLGPPSPILLAYLAAIDLPSTRGGHLPRNERYFPTRIANVIRT